MALRPVLEAVVRGFRLSLRALLPCLNSAVLIGSGVVVVLSLIASLVAP